MKILVAMLEDVEYEVPPSGFLLYNVQNSKGHFGNDISLFFFLFFFFFRGVQGGASLLLRVVFYRSFTVNLILVVESCLLCPLLAYCCCLFSPTIHISLMLLAQSNHLARTQFTSVLI